MNMKKILSIVLIVLVVITGAIVYQMAKDVQSLNAAENRSGDEQQTDVTVNQEKENIEADENEDLTEEEDEELPEGTNLMSDPEATFDEKINYLMDHMTLEEKIGQMMVVGFASPTVDSHIKKMIEEYHVGGVILYDWNMQSPDQVKKLNSDLQKLAQKKRHSIPLMISVDQEGGNIVRMREHVSPIPSQQELGKRGDTQEIYSVAKRNAYELRNMGFNVNFAPVLDLSATDTRSFGTDPEKAFTFSNHVIQGFNEEGIVGTLKHFPGHGRSDIDPHYESSTVDADQLDLENVDIYPFKKMIEEVDHHNFFIMVTHFIYPAYDKKYPASISPVIIQDLLREKLGYTGIVVTDDLEMGAVTNLFSYNELGYHAVKAGADVLLVCHTFENQQQVYNGILQAVKDGRLSEEMIDDSVKRILRFKLER